MGLSGSESSYSLTSSSYTSVSGNGTQDAALSLQTGNYPISFSISTVITDLLTPTIQVTLNASRNSPFFSLSTGNVTHFGSPASQGNSTSLNSTNSNFTWTGDCWAQWNDYWSVSIFDQSLFASTEINVATVTTAEPLEATSAYYGDYTLTETETWTSVSTEGAYPVATFTITTTNTQAETDQSFTFSLEYTTGYATVETVVVNTTTIIEPTAKFGTVTAPSCVLPSLVPQCQSQWDLWLAGNLSEVLPFTCSYSNAARCSSAQSSWDSGLSAYLYTVNPVIYAADGYTPICTQASVAPSACSQLVSSFLMPPDAAGGDINGAHISISPWPSKSTLAPGCTLGCQTCAITGNSVQLFYWPVTTTANASGVAQTSATTAVRGSTEVLNLNGNSTSANLPQTREGANK